MMNFNIDIPSRNFEQHLALQGNQRIILSAPFGSGKTYFLENYFKNNDEYEVIHLFPVNYSVASNEDIFELIKYDILFELFSKEVAFDKLVIKHIESLLQFAAKNGHHILAPFLMLIPEIGKSMYSIYDKLQQLSETYFKEHEKKQGDDKKTAIDYLEGFTTQKGNIYEEDFYTQLIVQLIEQLKTNKDQTRETVLIIDDLDRVDPDHIFRIFNVLSAHLNHLDTENKFGFDRIILVCDIDNIHKIFQNRYGSDVDFSGYIDKFYSYNVFEFENHEAIVRELKKILRTINFHNLNYGNRFENLDNLATEMILYVLSALIINKQLTIRKIKKIIGKELITETYTPNLGGFYHEYQNNSLEIIILFEFLFFLFDSWDEIISVLDNSHEVPNHLISSSKKKIFIGCTIVGLDASRHKLVNEGMTYKYIHEKSNQEFEYRFTEQNDIQKHMKKAWCNVIRINPKKGDSGLDITDPLFMPLLVDTAKIFKDFNTIQFP